MRAESVRSEFLEPALIAGDRCPSKGGSVVADPRIRGADIVRSYVLSFLAVRRGPSASQPAGACVLPTARGSTGHLSAAGFQEPPSSLTALLPLTFEWSVAALVLALPLPALAQAGGNDLRAQIAKMDQAWQTTYNAGDAAALTALYTQDAKLMPPGVEPASGSAAIKAFFTTDIAGGAKNTLTLGDVVGFGDFALETGGWVATAADGKHLDHGTFMTFYKKVDGAWKIYRDTWNSSMKM